MNGHRFGYLVAILIGMGIVGLWIPGGKRLGQCEVSRPRACERRRFSSRWRSLPLSGLVV